MISFITYNNNDFSFIPSTHVRQNLCAATLHGEMGSTRVPKQMGHLSAATSSAASSPFVPLSIPLRCLSTSCSSCRQTLQSFLCLVQSAAWQFLLQYQALLHAEHFAMALLLLLPVHCGYEHSFPAAVFLLLLLPLPLPFLLGISLPNSSPTAVDVDVDNVRWMFPIFAVIVGNWSLEPEVLE